MQTEYLEMVAMKGTEADQRPAVLFMVFSSLKER